MEFDNIMITDSSLTFRNRWDHFLARFGYRRSHHGVKPGLYRIGEPGTDAPVLVSANYSLSFDALRSSLNGIDAFILVLDTDGVNLWCAAGKGTFGTDEIVRRVVETSLAEFIAHRTMILPQLGAPGVSAHEVKKRSGFRVGFGPVRSSDLPEYLQGGKATSEMRRIKFNTAARAVLIPVELVHIMLPVVAVVAVLRLVGVIGYIDNEALAGVLAGLFVVPLLLPWIPTKDFSSKGFIAGVLLAAPIIYRQFTDTTAVWWRASGTAAGAVLLPARDISLHSGHRIVVRYRARS